MYHVILLIAIGAASCLLGEAGRRSGGRRVEKADAEAARHAAS
jgi:hypothetical protein